MVSVRHAAVIVNGILSETDVRVMSVLEPSVRNGIVIHRVRDTPFEPAGARILYMLDPTVLEDLPLPTSKAELMERIPPARQALESLLDQLSEAQMVTPDESGWSVKDHLAHLATWERMIVAHLQAGNDNEIVGLDDAAYAAAGLNELNAVIERRHKDQPLADVLDDFHRSHAAIVAELNRLPDAGFARSYWEDDPEGRTVLDKVAGDTYRHYLEHRRWILDLLNQIRQ
jgi:hypothetical protein